MKSVFVISDALRHGALSTIDSGPDGTIATAASVAAEQLLRRGAFTEGMEVAFLGRRWRIASQAARLACARGEISFDGLLGRGAARIPFREGMKDPFFALILALGAGPRLTPGARAKLLGFAAIASGRVGESDEDDLFTSETIRDAPEQERRMWGALIGLVSNRLLEDWGGLGSALDRARTTMAVSARPVIARAGALRGMLIAQMDLAAALLGRPARYLIEEHLRHSTALEEHDREAALGAVALASALKGEIRAAASLLDARVRGTEQAPGRPAPQEELARALISVERSVVSPVTWAARSGTGTSFGDAGLDDLRLLVEARVEYRRQSSGERALGPLSLLARRVDGLPWAVAHATAFRVEMLLTNGHLAQAFRANEEAQRGRFASWPVVRLALAKTRYAQNQSEAALRIAESVWVSEAASRRERARAYALGAACAARLGRRQRQQDLIRELQWISEETGLIEAFYDLPDEIRGELRPRNGVQVRPGLPEPSEPMRLTDRERAVLMALDEFSSTDDIATALHVSRNTVKTQLRHVYRKLAAHTREEALRAAADNGLL